jgi:hypothetical protein
MSLTAALFLAAFAAGLGLALLRNPVYGLYTYLAAFYLDPPSRWWAAGLPDLRWSLVAACVTAVAMFRLESTPGRRPWYRTAPATFLLAYTALLWIQSPWALDPELHRQCAVYFTKYIVVYYMIYRMMNTPQLVGDFMVAHVVGSFYLGWLAFNINVSGRLDGVGGPGIDDSNTLGMHMATAAVAGAMIAFAMRGWRRYVAIAAMPFILNTIVLTGSRGAFLALFMGGVTIFLLRPRQNARVFYALAALGVVGFGYVASTTFWQRMQTIEIAARQESGMDNSAAGRIAQFHAGLRMSADHPLGVGHRGFAVLSSRYLPVEDLDASGARSSHNTFITALVEQGWIGAIMFTSLVWWIILSCRRSRKTARAGSPLLETSMMAACCAGLVVVVVGGMFADFLQAEVQVWLLALLASLQSSAEAPAARGSTTPNDIRKGASPGFPSTRPVN